LTRSSKYGLSALAYRSVTLSGSSSPMLAAEPLSAGALLSVAASELPASELPASLDGALLDDSLLDDSLLDGDPESAALEQAEIIPSESTIADSAATTFVELLIKKPPLSMPGMACDEHRFPTH
jgi:hypothetical protein